MELIEATKRGDIQDVISLLERGVNINAKDNNGLTSLHYASYLEHLEIVILLLEAGANINEQTNLGGTPLHCASWWRRLQIVEVLLRNGANTEISNNDRLKPKKYAISEAILKLFEYYESIPDIKEPECE